MTNNPMEHCPDTRCPVCYREEWDLKKCPTCLYDAVCKLHGCTNPECNPAIAAYLNPQTKWENLCKRTDDPKLKWIEQQLWYRGIPSRRGRPSGHAEATLDVPEQFAQAAWDFLGESAPRRYRRWYKTWDDMPDEHDYFRDWHSYLNRGTGEVRL